MPPPAPPVQIADTAVYDIACGPGLTQFLVTRTVSDHPAPPLIPGPRPSSPPGGGDDAEEPRRRKKRSEDDPAGGLPPAVADHPPNETEDREHNLDEEDDDPGNGGDIPATDTDPEFFREIWVSPVLPTVRALAAAPTGASSGWSNLVLGLHVPRPSLYGNQVVLEEADATSLREVQQRLATPRDGRAAARLVARARVEFTRTKDGWTSHAARIYTGRSAFAASLIQPLTSVLDLGQRLLPTAPTDRPADRQRTASTVPTRADQQANPRNSAVSEDPPDLLEQVGRRISIIDSRGVQVGRNNYQLNRFVVRGSEVHLRLPELLQRADVSRAIAAYHADPTDTALRADVLKALTTDDTRASYSPVTVRLGSPEEAEYLDIKVRMTFVQAAQIGDGNTQRNTFTYTYRDTPADELLRRNPDLATAVLDLVCPTSTDRQPRLADLTHRLQEALHRAASSTLDRKLGVTSRFPNRGEHLVFSCIDGLTVGDRNRQFNQARTAAPDISTRDQNALHRLGTATREALRRQSATRVDSGHVGRPTEQDSSPDRQGNTGARGGPETTSWHPQARRHTAFQDRSAFIWPSATASVQRETDAGRRDAKARQRETDAGSWDRGSMC
jgi:hypothetical protein